MDKRYVKRTPLIFRETEIKTTVRYYFTPVRMAVPKQKQKQKTQETQKTSICENVEKLGLLCTVVGMENGAITTESIIVVLFRWFSFSFFFFQSGQHKVF